MKYVALLRVDEPLQRPDGKAFPEKRELADGGLLCPVSGSFCPYVQRVENRGFKGVPSDLLTGIKPSFCKCNDVCGDYPADKKVSGILAAASDVPGAVCICLRVGNVEHGLLPAGLSAEAGPDGLRGSPEYGSGREIPQPGGPVCHLRDYTYLRGDGADCGKNQPV